MPAFHPRSGLCCCLFASSARAALSWGADGPVPARTPGAAGRPLCGLAGKSSPGTEHGAQPRTKPSCLAVPALPTSFPPGQGEVSISPWPKQGPTPRQGILRACGTRPKLQPRHSDRDAAPWARLGCHLCWPRCMAVPSWSPLGPRATSFPAALPPRSPWAPVSQSSHALTVCCPWPSPHIPTSHPHALGNWHEPRGEGSVGTCHGP